MAVTFTEGRYRSFGRCLRIRNAFVEIVVTLDVGPRILRYAVEGTPNFFYEDRLALISESGPEETEYYGRGANWRLYGGMRACPAPVTVPLSTFPDNNRVRYEVSGRSVTFQPPPQRKNGLQLELCITLEEFGPEADVCWKLTNTGSAREAGLWLPAALPAGAIAVLPACRQADPQMPDRNIAFWPGTSLGDRRLSWSGRHLMLRQDVRLFSVCRLQLRTDEDWMMHCGKESLMVRHFEPGADIQVSMTGPCCQIGPVAAPKRLEHGERISLRERWTAAEEERLPRFGDGEAAEELERTYITGERMPE